MVADRAQAVDHLLDLATYGAARAARRCPDAQAEGPTAEAKRRLFIGFAAGGLLPSPPDMRVRMRSAEAGNRRWAFALMVSALGCLAICAPGAGAKAKTKPGPAATKLLPRRSCKGLLSTSDFPGSVREFVGKAVSDSTGYSTDCIYFPPEPGESDPEPEGGGVDYLTVTTRSGYEYKGKPLNLIEGPLLKQAEAKGEVVIHLHGIGTHADIVYEKGNPDVSKGSVQVRNDVFSVEKGDIVGMKGVLSRVAHELSPTGR